MRRTAIAGLLAVTAVALTACGKDSSAPTTKAASVTTAPAASAAPATTAAAQPSFGGTIAVKAGNSSLGRILVGADGKTLYAFTNDTEAKSTCTSTCADAWPPVIVDGTWNVGPGLDSGVFSTIVRDDGSEQLVAGRFPLYEYSGDNAAGDLNGQASGDVWFAVGLDARILKAGGAAAASTPATTTAAAPATTVAPAAAAAAVKATVATAPSKLGTILVDAQGRTLYAFTKDADGTSTCDGNCAKAWPPVTVQGTPAAGAGIDGKLLTTVPRADGTAQLKIGKWPLYTFSGDGAPGDTNGQGSAGSWFVVGADGKLVKS
jgi:predicted lipoprotein with Yx(FWY)xxD motif